MPTIGEVYNPLIEAAISDNPESLNLLTAVGCEIYKFNPDKCKSIEDGVEAAKRNLDYYCQYFDEKVACKVKSVYNLGQEFRCLTGTKI